MKLLSRQWLISWGVFSLLIGWCNASEIRESKVFLTNANSEKLHIGDLEIEDQRGQKTFNFILNEQAFGNYFLSMRPFKCIENGSKMLCHLPYLYEKPAVITDAELRPLEYDFLFIQRSPTEYGIDPWNGLYYKIVEIDGQFVGTAHALDLNVLASPPSAGETFPITDDQLHPVNPENLWLPQLLIESQP